MQSQIGVHESSDSGIQLTEVGGPGRALSPVRELLTAFIGPAPRGPADIPVAVRSEAEFLRRFGLPDRRFAMAAAVRGYFANGGRNAIIVRIAAGRLRRKLALPGPAGALLLDARDPGAHEHLRAAVDYDGIAAGETHCFNLVLQRVQRPDRPIVEAQEQWARVSVDPADDRFIGALLLRSELVRLAGELPLQRPDVTVAPQPCTAAYRSFDEVDGAEGDPAEGDYDLIGSQSDRSGLHALDQVPVIDLVCLLPARDGSEIGPVAWLAAERYCRRRSALLLLDPPDRWTSVAEALRDRRADGIRSVNAAMLFPVPAGGLSGALAGGLAAAFVRGDRDGPELLLRTPGMTMAIPETTARERAALSRNGLSASVPHSAGRIRVPRPVTFAGAASSHWSCLRRRLRGIVMLGDVQRELEAVYAADGCDWQALATRLDGYLTAMQAAGHLAGQNPAEGFWLERLSGPGGRFDGLALGLAFEQAGMYRAFHYRRTSDGFVVEPQYWQPPLARVI